MASSPVIKLVCLAVFFLALGVPKAKAAVTCNQVVNSLMPCVSYVMNGGNVPAQCCNGIRSLYGQAQTTPDRQAVCSCIKNAVNGIPASGYTLNLAAGLPAKCGVNIPYQISPATDCSRYSQPSFNLLGIRVGFVFLRCTKKTTREDTNFSINQRHKI